MRLPDFLIIGAAKAGTTTVYRILARHPGLFLPERKEPEFFARDDQYAAGIESYAAMFAAAAPGQICGEASTLYSNVGLFPETPARIHRHVPGAKLIYILREPVARSYSYYVQVTKNYQNATQDWQVHRSFEESVFPDEHPRRAPRDKGFAGFDAHLPDRPETFLGGSDYVAQIEAYQRFFPASQMLFLKFEDVTADTPGSIARICRFLGLDPAGLPEGALAITANISEDHFRQANLYAGLDRLRASLPLADRLRPLVPGALRRAARSMIARRMAAGTGRGPAEPQPMRPETAARLRSLLHARLPRLAELTGLDVTDWTRPDRKG